MGADHVIELVRDFTAQLSMVALEFGERANMVIASPAVQDTTRERDQAAKIAVVRALIQQRRLRDRFLPGDLFHEPAWDMLLALYLCWHESRVVNVKALIGMTEAPVTTGQRWIDHLAKLGLVIRTTDMVDRRRIEVAISDAGLAAIDDYLSHISSQP